MYANRTFAVKLLTCFEWVENNYKNDEKLYDHLCFKSYRFSKSVAVLKSNETSNVNVFYHISGKLTPMNRIYKYRKLSGLFRGARAQ